MAAISAKDVQQLRKATGVGMMDAKSALEACDGDVTKATKIINGGDNGLQDRQARYDGALAVLSGAALLTS